jgi:hypothetical protein
MKASPFSSLILTSLLIAFSITSGAQSGQYTVQIDSMTAQDAAEGKVRQLKSQGQNAYWLKSNVPGQGLRYRVRIGRFPSRAAAQSFGARLKQQGLAADFFVALFEGASSPLGTAEPVKKPEPASALNATPKAAPTENKAAENKTVVPAAPGVQKQHEVKPTPPANSNRPSIYPAANAPTTGSASKPLAVPPTGRPTTVPNQAAPKSVPVTPTETKSLESKPPLLTPLENIKPPRERKASNTTPADAATSATASPTVATVSKPEPLAGNGPNTTVSPAVKTAVTAAIPAAPTAHFQRFEERSYGYSFEHPGYWNGGRLNPEELQAQRIDAGAVFRSQEDVAFMNAIWNSLKNANSPAYDNNLIVDLVIKSLSSGTGLQGLSEVSRRIVQEGDQVKTFVDLRTLFRQPRANSSLEFQGKAVIIRANTGILLVVTFYSKDSAPTMMAAAERIIGSARVP